MTRQRPPNRPRRAAARKPKKKPRNLETTVAEIAQRPAPIRRNIFNLLDTLISSREPTGDAPTDDAPFSDPPPDEAPQGVPRRKGRIRGNPGSR